MSQPIIFRCVRATEQTNLKLVQYYIVLFKQRNLTAAAVITLSALLFRFFVCAFFILSLLNCGKFQEQTKPQTTCHCMAWSVFTETSCTHIHLILCCACMSVSHTHTHKYF